MKYLIMFIFIISYFLFPKIGFSTTSDILSHYLYHFSHASILHLVGNCLSFLYLYNLISKHLNKHTLLLLSFIVASLSSFFCEYSTITVGASGIIYSMMGLFIGMVLNKRLIIIDVKQFLLLLIPFFLLFIVSYFKKNSNFTLHSISLMVSISISFFILKRKSRFL